MQVKRKIDVLSKCSSFVDSINGSIRVESSGPVNSLCNIKTEVKAEFENGKVCEVADDNKDAACDTLGVGTFSLAKSVPEPYFSGTSLFEHKCRLISMLNKLMRKHRWMEAAGVLSTLLVGTYKDKIHMKNRRKYWVAMELLRQIASSKDHSAKINRIYEIWMTKQGPWSRVSNNKTYLIQLENALLHFMQENVEGAFNITRFLVQEHESGTDPIVNMIHGLILYQLWYSGIPEVMQLKYSNMPTPSRTSGMGPSDGLYPKFDPAENSDHHVTIDIPDVKCSNKFNSDSSIGNNKEFIKGTYCDSPRKQFNRVLPKDEFYMNRPSEMSEHEDDASYHDDILRDVSIFQAYGLDRSVLPIQLQQSSEDGEHSIYSHRMLVNEYHKDGVKHLRFALHSNPPVSAALLPLVQLLLLGDQVEEALKELKKFSHISNNPLPFRLRARLLKSFYGQDSGMLSTCHEDIIKRDPTSRDSLMCLVKIYHSGNYQIEPLVEMIALHLDATYATCDIWGELASCLFKLQTELQFHYEEDQMSTERQTTENDVKQAHFVSAIAIPKAFAKRESRKLWKLRCRWWSTRHFSNDIYLSEMQTGDWQLLTTKAACACHLYGPDFEYVKSVYCSLKKAVDDNRTLFLLRHMENPMKLIEKLWRTN